MLLHIGAADQRAWVYVNGLLAGTHTGGYTPFQSDITRYVKKGENVLVVKCEDGVNMTTPRGKQSFKNGGKPFACWYVPSTGIWQSVWLETFETDCISRYTLLSDIDNGLIYGDVTLMYGIADEPIWFFSNGSSTSLRCWSRRRSVANLDADSAMPARVARVCASILRE